eukprot:TRINITY_DN8912_c0_g3_i4.p2 TRINITY_DN8912_c0_g3~~TRINITY_DN8912_c0_g3_i4.p2  ORF type:complete len:101 (-),score=20.03 TRINITY_DN8912_c0_g3_i4:87-389(-)
MRDLFSFFFFFFKQKTAYEIMPSLVGSEMCIRDRSQKSYNVKQYDVKQNLLRYLELINQFFFIYSIQNEKVHLFQGFQSFLNLSSNLLISFHNDFCNAKL